MKALLPFVFLLSACTFASHEAHNGSKWEKDLLVKVGGTASQKGADGSSIVTDDQTSLRDVANATAMAVGMKYTARTAANQETTKQITAKAKGTALIKGTKDPNVIPVDPNVIPANPNIIPK